jgi:alpha-beta hydrolase superfamily lysophospholipase
MNTKTFNWTTPDGILIQGYHWDSFHAKAAVVWVHGLGEYAGRYADYAKYLSTYGIASVGYDRRGHGRSGGKRGHSPSYEALQEEVMYLLAHTRELYPTVPIFLYGHSMGGNLVLYNALNYRPDITGVIAGSPWIELTERPPLLKVLAGRIASKIAPGFSLPNGLDPRHLSRDSKAVEAYLDDPLVHDQISASAGTAMIDSGRWLASYKKKSEIPILIMHGSEDRLTSPEASQAFAGQVKGDITFVSWDGAYHELHHEPNKAEVMEVARKWMEEHLDTNIKNV